jgi:hypothetical protein
VCTVHALRGAASAHENAFQLRKNSSVISRTGNYTDTTVTENEERQMKAVISLSTNDTISFYWYQTSSIALYFWGCSLVIRSIN